MKAKVAIVHEGLTNGCALRVPTPPSTRRWPWRLWPAPDRLADPPPRYLLPIREGQIHFAEPLSDEAILIAAEGRDFPGRYRENFLATVDASTGQITRRSAPFEMGYWTRFFVTRDRSVIFASRGYSAAFLCWRADTLDLVGRFNRIRETEGKISFDHHERYYEVVMNSQARDPKLEVQTHSAVLRFHSEALRQEYEAQQASGQFTSLHDVREPLGQAEDGAIVLPVFRRVRVPDSKSWREQLEDDGFLLIDPATWTAKRAPTHGLLVKEMSEASHKKVYDDTGLDGMAAATLTVPLNGQSHADCMAALEEIAERLRSGVDNLRFGNSLNVALKLDDKTIDEQKFCELLSGYTPKKKEEHEERLRLLEAVLTAYTDRIAAGRANGQLKAQLYSRLEDDGVAALSAFVAAYLKLWPASLDAVRRYVRQLDEHCRDDFLCNCTHRHMGFSERELRVFIMSHLHMRTRAHDWNSLGALDAAARGGPERFDRIFEEELEKLLQGMRQDGCSPKEVACERDKHRSGLLMELRDDFDRRLRQLMHDRHLRESLAADK